MMPPHAKTTKSLGESLSKIFTSPNLVQERASGHSSLLNPKHKLIMLGGTSSVASAHLDVAPRM